MWTKVSDDFNDDPVMMALDRDARLAYVEVTTWSVKHLQDGFVPPVAFRRASDTPDPERAAAELVKVGLLVPEGDGYRLVRFAAEQMSAADVQKTKDKWVADKTRARQHKKGDHSTCIQGDYCPAGAIQPQSRSRRSSTVEQPAESATESLGPSPCPVPSPSPTPREDKDEGTRESTTGTASPAAGAAGTRPLRDKKPTKTGASKVTAGGFTFTMPTPEDGAA